MKFQPARYFIINVHFIFVSDVDITSSTFSRVKIVDYWLNARAIENQIEINNMSQNAKQHSQ